ncbi:23S rRNA (uracil(1939)-C(5))-methyltransferase RlmD [Anaerotignum lactatifermentans]|uniref:23S rRNA (Uracil(1939)-C(5))-methyltransferase RlmD n=1 Tax=Anaerotignum lactatifermentans TaxID=160404 RepID=A0ABS2G7X1_9FIRM|nr:23S rRNA (uracil(1939)-C(5))-methyltransferase RlmD [Anaerotignum lactatifermentans]MBM6828850.1 23S rRNA (uracil(1939)-C(5))-methyltransferase RlmD [Anaerotignum lactatifermentans]MBM6876977.1 23S rRNA (uracil(1939)-C(5))-methyltransferase RlmD [Anaerotignum lactatifermentans]MBM6950535.1 23S rRNA (uracil(1939)-C(5))-methyltransferase RlmD [Anaerotignum lactatifermentans]
MELPVQKNQEYEINIEDLGNNGEGIGRIDGYTVFVEGALPGERVRVLIVKTKKHYGYGKLREILMPSPDRVAPACPVAARCGGCQLQHLSYEAQLRFKTKKVRDHLERIGGFSGVEVLPALGMEDPWRYRNKAQFPVGGKTGEPEIGFYAKRSHRIIDTPVCMLQNEVNDRIVKIVRTFLAEFELPLYDETIHRGLVRHILTRIGRHTGEIMVCLVVNGKKLPHSDVLVERLRSVEGMTSIVLNVNTAQNNVILGSEIHVLWGKEYITDTIGTVEFEISPLSFYQVNPVQTRVLYQTALDFADLDGSETVLDLYCGIGTISLFFARKAKKVFGVEIVPQAIADAKRNAAQNNIENAFFQAGAAEEVIPRLYQTEGIQADVVVVDPPRKGCDQRLLETILEIGPKKLVYVSCDSATLARDLAYLCPKGYRIEKVQVVDQFPWTVHVESVALLSRE